MCRSIFHYFVIVAEDDDGMKENTIEMCNSVAFGLKIFTLKCARLLQLHLIYEMFRFHLCAMRFRAASRERDTE